jgi:hypothetical protein
LADELANLQRYLPAEIKILVGGRAAEAYREALQRIGAPRVADLNGLMATLDQIRKEQPIR